MGAIPVGVGLPKVGEAQMILSEAPDNGAQICRMWYIFYPWFGSVLVCSFFAILKFFPF